MESRATEIFENVIPRDLLTIIVPFRNRDLVRVQRFMESLEAQTRRSFVVIFVDYGSRASVARRARLLLEQYSFCQYVYSDTRGLPWNNSVPLNIALRRAETEYILATDIDIIFAPNFIETLLRVQNGHRILNCKPISLPRDFEDWQNIATYADRLPRGQHKAQLGVCQCYPRSAAIELRGYDEICEYYGGQDHDIQDRLIRKGLKQYWVDHDTEIFHQWHPTAKAGIYSFQEQILWPHFREFRETLVRNGPHWGAVVGRKDRHLIDLLPEGEEELLLEWPMLIDVLAKAASRIDCGARWYITNRPFENREADMAVQDRVLTNLRFNAAVIHTSWPKYLLLSAEELERRFEQSMNAVIEELAAMSSHSPRLIVLDLDAYLRISHGLFRRLVGSLAPLGILAVANLGQPRMPPGLRWFGRFVVPTSQRIRALPSFLPGSLRAEARSASTAIRHRSRQVDSFFLNNLLDSTRVAWLQSPAIIDCILDFPSRDATGVFLAGESEAIRQFMNHHL